MGAKDAQRQSAPGSHGAQGGERPSITNITLHPPSSLCELAGTCGLNAVMWIDYLSPHLSLGFCKAEPETRIWVQAFYLGDDPRKNTWVMRKGRWTGGEPTKHGSGVPGRAFVDHAPKHLPQNETCLGIYPSTALPCWLRLKIRPLAPWWLLCPGGQRMASGGGSHSYPSARQWPSPQPSLAALSTLTTPS